jgi:purine-binding chemotaxis protein CheW
MLSRTTLTVTAGARRYAVPLAAITEIIRVPSASPVPLAPAWLLGLINHRGAILPMIDLEQRLGGAKTMAAAQSRVLVGTAGAAFLVQAVDAGEATDVLDLAALLPADATVAEQRAAPPARETVLAGEDEAEGLLGVLVADQAYAFPLDNVEAVSGFAGDPEGLGVISWRGQSLPVASLRGLLGAAGDDTAHPGRVAVVRVGDGACVALRVDGFAGILRVPARQRHPVPALLARGRPMLESLCRLDGGALVCVLSAARLMGGAAAAPAARPEGRVTAQDDAYRRFIVFRLGSARFAAPLQAIESVLGDAPLAPVPGAPSYIAGVRRLHGRVLPVADVRRALAMPFDRAGEPAGACKTLVVMLDHDVHAGVVVDAVERILSVAPRDIRPAPPVSGLVTQVLSTADGGPLLPVLDLPRLLAALGQSGVPPGESLAALLAAIPAQAA